jgi:ferredoxin
MAAERRWDALPVIDPHKTRCGPVRPSRRGRIRAAVLILVHVAILAHVAHWKIAGRTLSPVEPSEAMQTLELGYLNAGFILFLVLILLTLVTGRLFCGWACHVVAYQDLAQWLLRKMRLRPRPVRSRLLILVPFGAAFYMFAWPQVVRLFEGGAFPALTSHLTTANFWETFPGPVIATVTFLVDGFLIVYLMGGKGFCTYGCPYGAVFGLADRAALGRIRVTEDCEQCGHCTATCTSNVRVHEEVAKFGMVVDNGCMKTMDCISVCPKNALFFQIGRPKLLEKRPKGRKKRRVYDFTWREEIAMAAVFLGGLYAFRGLYGQIPFLLAIGMSVILALLTVLGWRLIRRSELSFQHHALRSYGRLTRRGAATAVIIPAVLLLTIHSAFVQFHAREGERLLLRAEDIPREDRADLLRESLDHFLAAERWGFLPVGTQKLKIGSILREQGDLGGAEAWMREAVGADASLRTPRLELAGLLIMRNEDAEAEQVLLDLLDIDPENEQAKEWLRRVRERSPR